MMYKLCAALLFAGAAISSPVPEAESGHQGYSTGPKCHQNVEKKCHQKPIQKERQECHEEFDVVIDTTYIEKCEDIITKHCQETHQQVHKSSHVVGHDSHVVDVKHYGGAEAYGYGSHHGKREAKPGHGHGYSSGPQCQEHVEKKCHKIPEQKSHKVPRPVCKTVVDTTYIEECEDIVIEHCEETHQQVHHSSQVVGHDSQVIHGGHGGHYGKRAAEADPGQEYHSGPKCHQNVEKQCHQKPVEKERQECHEEYDVVIDTVYTEECEDIITRHCQQVHTQVHKSSHVVGHDSHIIHGGHGDSHHKREAEHGYGGHYGGHHGYSSEPQCQEHVEKKCHKIPEHKSHKVPRPVCKTVVDTTYIEECEDIVTEHCEEHHKEVHHSSQVVGHDQQVIKGHGHH